MTIKLSETQDAAIREVAELGYTVAKANTIKSLENKGLIEATSNTHHKLTDDGREYLGIPSQEVKAEDVSHEELKAMLQGEPTFHEKLMSDVAELEQALNTNPWDETPEVDLSKPEFQVMTFDSRMPLRERELAGFGGLERWSNTKVWDGLTAQEIRDDLDTEHYVNRKARREGAKMARKAVKAFAAAALALR